MEKLRRIEVDKFDIEKSVKINELLIKKNNIISIEEFFKDKECIELNDRKLELFLNGVRLTYNNTNGLYKIYNNNRFIGIGSILDNLLKREIIM